MIFWLYNILLILLAPFWVPWMIWRTKKRNEKPNWKQRTGDLPLESPKKGVRRAWVHAVSVGEVMAAVPVLREIRTLDPDLEIVLSTTTSSGQTAAKEKAEGLYDHLIYFPIDVPRFVVSAMIRVRPKVVAVMETELWMNFLWAAKEFRAKTILINGRISDRSYPRSMRIKPYYNAMFENLDQALVQTDTDVDRFRDLGFRLAERAGNTKFDAAIEEAKTDKDWRQELEIPAEAKVIVIGSTRSQYEEMLIIQALKGFMHHKIELWVIHAPRHIERAPQLKQLYQEVLGDTVLRSEGGTGNYLILDTYGELGSIYSIADVVVIGGGFEDMGGQNIIQPLAHGKPVIHGPFMQNFKVVAEQASKAEAAFVAHDTEELARAIKVLMDDEKKRKEMGQNAKVLVQNSLGASKRCAEAVVEAAKAD